VDVRPLDGQERSWLRASLVRRWGLPVVSTSGVHDAAELPALVAEERGRILGVATYRLGDGECEVVTLDSFDEGRGVGTALLDAVRVVAHARDARLWLITTNENFRALRFYQRRGMDMVALHRDFVDVVRRSKAHVEVAGHDGVAFRHAIEFEDRR